MASLRSATRAFLSEGHGPGSVLTKLSSMVDVTRDGHYATALFGVIDLKRRRLRLASAGHLAPVLITAGKPELVDIAVGPPVGAASERTHYVETTVALPPDGQLLLFTDGLVERRGESIDEGLERLLSWVRTIVAAHSAADIEILLGTLMDHTRDDGIKDDTAVMGAQWTS